MRSFLELKNITVKYGEEKVLDNVSVKVAEGEFFVIIGPNGAGKTTLLKVASGLQQASIGEVLVKQQHLHKMSKKGAARSLALVPQHLGMDFPFTVAETVLMGRYPHLGILAMEGKNDLEMARQAMEFTEVAHLAGRRLDQLSGGERQRVVIARAICQQSDILLLDEPTASLDPAHQLKIMDLMERFRQQQKVAIVMVSHDLNLASAYADRLMLIKDGIVEKVGAPDEVITETQLTQIYGCNLLVDQNPLLKTPRVSLTPEK